VRHCEIGDRSLDEVAKDLDITHPRGVMECRVGSLTRATVRPVSSPSTSAPNSRDEEVGLRNG
jgi:hypothetical protein